MGIQDRDQKPASAGCWITSLKRYQKRHRERKERHKMNKAQAEKLASLIRQTSTFDFEGAEHTRFMVEIVQDELSKDLDGEEDYFIRLVETATQKQISICDIQQMVLALFEREFYKQLDQEGKILIA